MQQTVGRVRPGQIDQMAEDELYLNKKIGES